MTQYTVRKTGSYREGDTRTNPQTGKKEMLDPSGTWILLRTGMQPTTQPTSTKTPPLQTTTPRAGLTQAPGYKPLTPKTATQPFSTAFSPLTVKETGGKIVPDTTTPPPIITPTDKPTVGVSQIDAGKQAIKDLTSIGVSTDINTIRSNWAKFGLDTKLGTWVGSAVQWNAYAKYAKDELGKAAVSQTDLQQKLYDQVVAAGATPATALNAVRQIPGGDPNFSPAEVGTTGETVGETTEGTTSIPPLNTADLIGKISSGEYKIPEIEIAKEATTLAKDKEKARAGQALENVQQDLASRGMTFSSIRTTAEAKLQAEHLANMSGISLQLAASIIEAARQEATRQEPKYYSMGNALYEIIPGQSPRKIIEGPPSAPEVIGSASGGYFQWNSKTNSWESLNVPLGPESAPQTVVKNGILYQWDGQLKSWKVAPGIPNDIGSIMSDEDWAGAIKMGIDKLSSIENSQQRERVLKLLSSKELLLERYKEDFEFLIKNNKMTVADAESEIWKEYIDEGFTVEEAQNLINFIKNLDARIKEERGPTGVSPEEFGKGLRGLIGGLADMPSNFMEWARQQDEELKEFGKGLLGK